MRNLSRLISDYLIYIFLLTAWFSAPEPVNTSASGGVLGTIFGPWAGSPRANCVPLGLLVLDLLFQKCTLGTKKPCCLLPDPERSLPLKKGVELMGYILPTLTSFSILFFPTELTWHVVETNRHLQKGSVSSSEVFRRNSKPDVA